MSLQIKIGFRKCGVANGADTCHASGVPAEDDEARLKPAPKRARVDVGSGNEESVVRSLSSTSDSITLKESSVVFWL